MHTWYIKLENLTAIQELVLVQEILQKDPLLLRGRKDDCIKINSTGATYYESNNIQGSKSEIYFSHIRWLIQQLPSIDDPTLKPSIP